MKIKTQTSSQNVSCYITILTLIAILRLQVANPQNSDIKTGLFLS